MTDKFTVNPPTQIALDRLKFAAQTRLSEAVLATARVSTYEDIAMRQLVMAMEVEILAEKLVSEQVSASTKIPASWWQHFKLTNWYLNLHRDRIMRYCAKRWPVRYTERIVTARFTRYATFPNSTLRVPALGAPVVFEQWGEARWDDV